MDERRETDNTSAAGAPLYRAAVLLLIAVLVLPPGQYARFNFILLTPACTRPHTKSANDSFGSGLEDG